jgi:hypothetical protein
MKTKREIATVVTFTILTWPVIVIGFASAFVAHAWCVGVEAYKACWGEPT